MIKQLYKIVKSQEKFFEKGQKLEALYPLYEAGASFLFASESKTKGNTHIRDSLDTKRWMIFVVLALLPCIGFGIYNVGFQHLLATGQEISFIKAIWIGLLAFVPISVVTLAVGGFWEALFAIVRKHEINEGFLVTWMLLPLTLPPTIPLWQVALGISFGVVIGKEVFGGTGKNFVNPALAARAFMYFSYPIYMSGNVWTFLGSAKDKVVDTYSLATPLGIAATVDASVPLSERLSEMGFGFMDLFWGFIPGSIGETSVLCVLIGAAILIPTRVACWRIILSCVMGALATGYLINFLAGDTSSAYMHLPGHWHLVIGSFAFGTVFMATEPVTAPNFRKSKWVYGFLIGFFTVIIRVFNPAYPEAVMLAILLMNVSAPLIDSVVLNQRNKKRIPNVV